MRYFTIIFVTAVVGIGLGIASTLAEFGAAPPDPKLGAAEIAVARAPKVVVNVPVHEFGRMYQNEEGHFTFVLRNEGLGTLSLSPGKPPCKCTVSKISRKTVPPGENAELTLTWKTGFSSGTFSKGLLVKTNDPLQPQVRLQISGTVTPEFRFDPPAIWLRSFSQLEPQTRDAKLYFYSEPPPELVSHAFSNEETADYFGVRYAPLAADELKQEELAISGYSITISIKPGLPAGPFQQYVNLGTSVPTMSNVRLEISGDVRTEIMLVGPRMDRDTNTLNIGTVRKGQVHTSRLAMQLMGGQRDKITYKVKECRPQQLHVTFGERRQYATGNLVTVPVVIEVPADCEAGSYLGSEDSELGYIILETSHPAYPEVRLNVKLAIAE